mgnify:CR=1 FL=1
MVKLDELMNLDMEDDILYLTTTRDGWVPVGGEIVGTITAYFSSIAFTPTFLTAPMPNIIV